MAVMVVRRVKRLRLVFDVDGVAGTEAFKSVGGRAVGLGSGWVGEGGGCDL